MEDLFLDCKSKFRRHGLQILASEVAFTIKNKIYRLSNFSDFLKYNFECVQMILRCE
jgi:uncharacterized protein YkuJ